MSATNFDENHFLLLFLCQCMSIPYMESLGREGGFFNTTHIDKLYKQWVSFKQIDTNWGSYGYRDVVFKFIEQNHEKQKCLLTENQQKVHKYSIFLLKT